MNKILLSFFVAVLEKNLNLDIVHTYKYKKYSGHSPKDLVNEAPDEIRTKQPNISGKTSPPWNYGIIHSKIFVADRLV